MFSETFIMNLKAGARYTESDTTGGGDDDTTSDTNFVGEVSVRWIFERSTLSALVNQQVVPSSGGEAVARTRVNLGLGYKFTEKLGSNLRGRYRRSDPLRGGQTVETFGGRVGLTYSFTENLGLSLDYSYIKTDQESNSVVDDETNRVFLQLRWLIHRPEWRVKPPKPLVKWPHRL
jgi:opacity protein-like surface antigen